MPLLSNALTTVAGYKEYMELDPEDISRDIAIEKMINSVSEWIEGECGRKFGKADYAKEFVGNGRQLILLDQYPVLTATVTQVMSDENAIFTDWMLEKEIGALKAKNGWNGLNYSVEYTAGYVLPKDTGTDNPQTLPADLESACIELVAIRLEMKSSNHLKTEVIGPLRSEYLPKTPYHIQAVIDRYKRVVIA